MMVIINMECWECPIVSQLGSYITHTQFFLKRQKLLIINIRLIFFVGKFYRYTQHFKVKTDHFGIIPSLLLKYFPDSQSIDGKNWFFVYYTGTLSLKYVFWTPVKKINILIKKLKKMVFGFGMFHILTPLLLEIQLVFLEQVWNNFLF